MSKNTNIVLAKQYKDHTVQNPVTSLKREHLPENAYKVHNQSIRRLHVTIQILDEKDNSVIETITGKASDGNISVDATSLLRRDATLKLSISDDIFPQTGSLIWFNRVCKVFVGIEDNSRHEETVNFLVGTFWVEEVQYGIDEDGHTIDVTLKDKMMKWDVQLEYPLVINIDTPIHIAMRSLMEHLGETDFGDIDESREGEVVPYTIKYSIGDNVQDLITELRDMYMDYVCGYNVNGEFEFRRIETQKEDLLEEPKWRFDAQDETLRTLISFSESYNLRNIKNRVLVYGGTSDLTGFTPIGEARVSDSKSPFNVNAIGQRTKVIVENRYVTNEQCMALAKYEIYRSSVFQEMADITTIPIYILDVFDIIDVKHTYTQVESKYLIDKISFGLSVDATMSIQAHKLYYTNLEYGEEQKPIVDYIIEGITTHGWIRLSEEAILKAFNIQGSGQGHLSITFVDHSTGGWQAAVSSYPTTVNQGMEFDVADFVEIDMNSPLGQYVPLSARDNDDAVSRIVMHEMFHAVMNDYLGHTLSEQTPLYFREGMAEIIHGAAQGRFDNAFSHLSNTQKKEELIRLAEHLLDNNFDGTSNDYVASYLIAWAMYRLATRNNLWRDMFSRMKRETNLSLNFLLKALPIARDNESVKRMVIQEIKTMDSIWNYLFSSNKQDTGSILGTLGMNIYGIPLTDENVLNVADYDGASEEEASIGFKIKFIR